MGNIGRLSPEVHDILKAYRYRQLSKEENNILLKNKVVLNSQKTATAGILEYYKLSEHLLVRHDVSYMVIPENLSEQGIVNDLEEAEDYIADLYDQIDYLEEQILENPGTPESAANEDKVQTLYEQIHQFWQPLRGREGLHWMLNSMEWSGIDQLFDTNRMEWQWRKYVSLSQELTTVLETMLQDIPAKRYQSATEVLAALTNQKKIVIFSPINPPKPRANTNVNINPQSSFTEDLGNGVKLEMIAIPRGTFWMGSPANEAERDDDEGPQHLVTVPSFFMGKYPLTQAQYQAIMGNNPSYFKGNNRPVERVSWDDAVLFCQKLSQRTGKNYRLPSEAEWEYACRAGTKTPFSFGDNITTDLVNYDGNYPYKSAPKGKYRDQTTDVGTFPPNPFGLYDMHGNVWEWCQDDWHENYTNAPTDGSSWNSLSGRTKLLRGGSWYRGAGYCRSASRDENSRDARTLNCGFRVRSSFRIL